MESLKKKEINNSTLVRKLGLKFVWNLYRTYFSIFLQKIIQYNLIDSTAQFVRIFRVPWNVWCNCLKIIEEMARHALNTNCNVHAFWQIIPTILSDAVILFIYAWKVQEIMAFKTFSVVFCCYPRQKSTPAHGGIRTYDLWNVSPVLCELHQLGI